MEVSYLLPKSGSDFLKDNFSDEVEKFNLIITPELIQIRRLNKLIFVLLAEQCHKPKNYFLNILNKKGHLDLYMTPQSAKKMNIVNHVKLPTIKIQIKTEMVLE